MDNLPHFGFIILRNVIDEKTNKYWKICYQQIRKYYTEKIIIIDDNSNNFLTNDIELVNCQVINSEFKKRGEFLAYYYFHKLKPFKKAIIIHDSLFINSKFFIDNINTFCPFFDFTSNIWDDNEKISNNITKLKNSEPIMNIFNNKNLWNGCFGVMGVITWEFLNSLEINHAILSNLIDVITDREQRMTCERIIIIVSQYYNSKKLCGLFGNIHNYCDWGIEYNDYINGRCRNLPVVKIWTGR